MSTALLIINPQVDFSPVGAVTVPGAEEDAWRIQKLIKGSGAKIASIHVTLDSHQRMHIAHPLFWLSGLEDDLPPPPFTKITAAHLKEGKWKCARPEDTPRVTTYLEKLAVTKYKELTIWPEHCLLASTGYSIMPPVDDALRYWAEGMHADIDFVSRGMHPFTDWHSVLQADIPDPTDTSTCLDLALITRLASKHRVLICGQSLSHAVRHTVEDLIEHWPGEEAPRLLILEDACSPMVGCEASLEMAAFLDDMRARGYLSTTEEAFA